MKPRMPRFSTKHLLAAGGAVLLSAANPALAQDTIAITEFFNNPSGGVAGGVGDSGREFFELYNYGNSAVDLNGWTVFDEGTNTFTITNSLFDTISAGGETQRLASSLTTDLILDPGEYAVFIGTQSFAPEFNGGILANEFLNEFHNTYFEGVEQENVFLLASFNDPNDFTTDPVYPGDGTIIGGGAVANGADELILNNGSGTTVWNVAYSNDESSGFSTFLTNRDFNTTDYGSEANPGVVRDGNDNGSVTTIGYIENGQSVFDATTQTDITLYDPLLLDNPNQLFDSSTNAATAKTGQFATPLEGFYGDNSITAPQDLVDTTVPLSASLQVGGGGELKGELAVQTTQSETTDVALVLTGTADPSPSGQGGRRIVELQALRDISEEELKTYGVGAMNNGSTFLSVESGDIEIAGGVQAGEFLYFVEDLSDTSDFFASTTDFITFTPFNPANIAGEDTGATGIDGNDAIILFKNGVAVDSLGQLGVNPDDLADNDPNNWEHRDGWLYRNDNVGPTMTFNISDHVVADDQYLTNRPINLAGDVEEVDRNAFLDLPNLEDFDGNAVTRTPFPIGTFDGSTIVAPDVETPVRGSYSFARLDLDSGSDSGRVDLTGFVPNDTVLLALDLDLAAGAPTLTELQNLLTASGTETFDLTDSNTSIAGITDNELYDDFELLASLTADGDGTFVVSWDFSLFNQVGGFSDNPLVNALGVGFFELELLVGDVNLDGEVNALDIDPFVTLLTGGGFQDEADINSDGLVNALDIDPFVGILTNASVSESQIASVQAVPEPGSLALLGLGGLALMRRRRA